MKLAAIRDKAIRLGVNWAAVKVAFSLGIAVGMLLMAVAMVGKEATVGLVKVGRAVVASKL